MNRIEDLQSIMAAAAARDAAGLRARIPPPPEAFGYLRAIRKADTPSEVKRLVAGLDGTQATPKTKRRALRAAKARVLELMGRP